MSAIDFQSLMKAERKKHHRGRRRPEVVGDSHSPIEERREEQQRPKSPTYPQSLSLPSSAFLTSFDRSLHLVSRDPASIYYVPSFLSGEYEKKLLDWLLTGIPRNPVESCSDARHSNGKWTQLKYAGRRVALFDSRIQPFPDALASLAKILSDMILLPLMTNKPDNHEATSPSSTTPRKNDLSFEINHILINDYANADVGILPHTDGPAYEPCTITLSMASSTRLEFSRRNQYQGFELRVDEDLHNPSSRERNGIIDQTQPLQVWLEPASLVVFCNDAYSEWLHSIPTSDSCGTVVDVQQCLNKNLLGETKSIYQDSTERRVSLTFRIARHSFI